MHYLYKHLQQETAQTQVGVIIPNINTGWAAKSHVAICTAV